jgi:hypothetical protein
MTSFTLQELKLSLITCCHTEISGIVGCNVFYFKTNPRRPVFKSNVPCRKESILKSLQQGDIPLIHSGIMGKREVFAKFPYKKSQFPVEDYRFFSELAIQKVSMANIPDHLTYVRIHDGSISRQFRIWPDKRNIQTEK